MKNAKLLDLKKKKLELEPTVIKCSIPFMEKRGAFKTYRVETAWRQTEKKNKKKENATSLQA